MNEIGVLDLAQDDNLPYPNLEMQTRAVELRMRSGVVVVSLRSKAAAAAAG